MRLLAILSEWKADSLSETLSEPLNHFNWIWKKNYALALYTSILSCSWYLFCLLVGKPVLYYPKIKQNASKPQTALPSLLLSLIVHLMTHTQSQINWLGGPWGVIVLWPTTPQFLRLPLHCVCIASSLTTHQVQSTQWHGSFMIFLKLTCAPAATTLTMCEENAAFPFVLLYQLK